MRLSGSQDQYFCVRTTMPGKPALEAVKDRPVTLQNKEKGHDRNRLDRRAGSGTAYGMFEREGFGTGNVPG